VSFLIAARWSAIALVLVGLTANVAAYPLLDPDEGRNAEIAREMAESGDIVLPRLNGLPYPDKPVLHFAATAAALRLFGASEFAARLPSLVFTLGTLALVAWFGRRLFGSPGAWIAAVAMGTTPLTLGFARTVIFDATLTFFVVVALVAFYEATDRRTAGPTDADAGSGSPARRPAGEAGDGWSWTVLAWAAIGCAILTKGPIGLALPLMIAAPYAAWRRVNAAVWTPVGPLACASLVLPWIIAIERQVPDLVEYAIVTETLQRLMTDRLQRTGPWWYFVPILLAGTLPWSAAVAAGWRSARPLRSPSGTRDHRTVFLLLWVLVPLVFFTLSQSKRPQYMLPMVPAVGLLAARVWIAGAVPGAWLAGLVIVAVGAAIAAAPAILPAALDLSSGIAATVPRTAVALGGVTVAAGALVWLLRSRAPAALAVLALPVAAIPFASRQLMTEIGRERSAAAIAEVIAPVLDPGSTVVAIRAFPLSLPFYLRRTILLATDSGRELTSTYLTERAHRWRNVPGTTLRPADWWRDALDDCRARVFVTRTDDRVTRAVLESRLPLLIETRKYAAYGPCGTAPLAAGA
jgi:4-amino-4-deoxy-L-arabinose transferase-like glycosyltransferase